MLSSNNHQKRIISDIRPSGGTKKPPTLIQKQRSVDSPAHHERQEQHSGNKAKKIGFRQIAIVIGALVVIAASVLWSSTLTLLVMRQERDFNMSAGGVQLSVAAKEFKTEIVERGEGLSSNVEAFSKRASGTVIVYNNYSSEPQVLVARTRLQSASGLIFRINNRAVVPGKKGDKPGSIEVEISADQSGEKYNVGFSDFKVPGFIGTPKYGKFFARSRADTKGDIKGGAAGQGKVVGKADSEALLKTLEDKVKANLATKLAGEIQDNFIIFPDTIEAVITLRVTDPPVGAPGDKFWGEIRGEAKVLAVDRSVYQATLAGKLFENKEIIPSFALPDGATLSCDKPRLDYTKNIISCDINGKVTFIGVVPVDELREKVLASNAVGDLKNIFEYYPGIKKVEQTFRPAFLKRIPSRSSQLIVQVR